MISVIIPTYNRAATLFAAAQSVLGQTCRNIELIIVDDGSTDHTAEVVSALRDERVRYIVLEKNQGACTARNRGIDAAGGEYIAFQDSDDIWRRDKLEKEIGFLRDTGADVVFCAIDRYACGSSEPTRFPYTNPSQIESKEAMFLDLLMENTVSTVTVLCKRECALAVRFDETLPRRQDWDWALRISQKYCMRYLNEVLVDSYAQGDSISYSSGKHLEALRIMREKYDRSIESNAEARRGWARRMADAAFEAGAPAAALCWRAFCAAQGGKYFVKFVLCVLHLRNIFLAYKKGRKTT